MFPFIPRACVRVCMHIRFVCNNHVYSPDVWLFCSPFLCDRQTRTTQHTLDRCSCPRPFPLHRQGHGHGFCGVARQVERGKMGRSRCEVRVARCFCTPLRLLRLSPWASWARGWLVVVSCVGSFAASKSSVYRLRANRDSSELLLSQRDQVA